MSTQTEHLPYVLISYLRRDVPISKQTDTSCRIPVRSLEEATAAVLKFREDHPASLWDHTTPILTSTYYFDDAPDGSYVERDPLRDMVGDLLGMYGSALFFSFDGTWKS